MLALGSATLGSNYHLSYGSDCKARPTEESNGSSLQGCFSSKICLLKYRLQRVSFPVGCDKLPRQQHLGITRASFSSQLRGTVHHGREAESAGALKKLVLLYQPLGSRERDRCILLFSSSSPFTQPRIPARGWCCPQRAGLRSSVHKVKEIPHRHAQRCIPWVTL